MNERTNERTNEWTNERENEWKSERTNGAKVHEWNIEYSLRNWNKHVFQHDNRLFILRIDINNILCEKSKEISQLLRPMKLKKWWFPAYFRHFRQEKIGLDHILGIPNTHLRAKNQRKLIMKSRENAKKNGFSVIYARKCFFPKSVTFQILPLCISVHNFMKKYEVYSSGNSRNTIYPAKIGYSCDF